MTDTDLFSPYDLGGLTLANRYIANNGYDLELANSRLAEGKVDLFAFGRPFIANPDLVERLKNGVALAELDPATLHGGGAKGYTDYPAATVAAEV